jgi:hypothetical protein
MSTDDYDDAFAAIFIRKGRRRTRRRMKIQSHLKLILKSF